MGREHQFDSFLARRDELAGGIGALADLAEQIGVPARATALRGIRKRLLSDCFRLMVVGEFKRGKSTLINAMLGEKVIPAAVRPCTAVITEVKYGDEKRAVLHPVAEGRDPLQVDVEVLKQHITIKDDDFDDDVRSPPEWARAEVFWPLQLCRNNVEIIDSPGLNEHASRTEVALDYLPRADALIMVLSCQQQLSQSERSFIDESLGDRDLSHVFFIWNHYDVVQDDEDEVAHLDKATERYLRPRVGGRPRVFPVSARDALRGRMRGTDMEHSGLPAFEGALESFLVRERGRVKLLAPLGAVEKTGREFLTQVLPQREAMLKAPLAELEQRYAKVLPKLQDLDRQKHRVERNLERRKQLLGDEIRQELRAFGAYIERAAPEAAENIVIGWTDATISRTKTQKKLQVWLDGWLKEELERFEEEKLNPLLARELEGLEAELEEDLRQFLDGIDSVRGIIAPELEVSLDTDEAQDVSAVNRVLSAVGGFLLSGPGGAIEGASHGYKSLVKSVPLYLGAAILLGVMGATTPVVIGVMAAIGIGRTIWTGKDMGERLRDGVTKEFARSFQKQLPSIERDIKRRVDAQYDGIISRVSDGMATLVGGVQQEIDEALAQKRRGEAAVDEGTQQLDAAGRRIGELLDQLAEVRRKLDAMG